MELPFIKQAYIYTTVVLLTCLAFSQLFSIETTSFIVQYQSPDPFDMITLEIQDNANNIFKDSLKANSWKSYMAAVQKAGQPFLKKIIYTQQRWTPEDIGEFTELGGKKTQISKNTIQRLNQFLSQTKTLKPGEGFPALTITQHESKGPVLTSVQRNFSPPARKTK